MPCPRYFRVSCQSTSGENRVMASGICRTWMGCHRRRLRCRIVAEKGASFRQDQHSQHYAEAFEPCESAGDESVSSGAAMNASILGELGGERDIQDGCGTGEVIECAGHEGRAAAGQHQLPRNADRVADD